MPSFNIGPGVRQAMLDAGDEPRSDELYQSSAPNPTVSLTYGKNALYVYYGQDNATRRLPFDAGSAPPPPRPQPDWAPDDLRGKLPTNREANYAERPLSGITGVTFHYTAGPASQTAHQVAAYQTSEAARGQTGNGTPFPGLAYTLFVEEDGRVILAHSLETRTWHSAATVGGKARNATHIGICFSGNYDPNRAQLLGLARAKAWCELQFGRPLQPEGHGWVYPTACPGPNSRVWIPEL